MTFTTVLFYILAAVLVIAAFRVITARSPVTAVLHLILAFANAAMLWMLLGAEFLALLLDALDFLLRVLELAVVVLGAAGQTRGRHLHLRRADLDVVGVLGEGWHGVWS